MKIVIDNNIILDALLEREPFAEDAKRILTACADVHTGCISANSLTDIFYVLRKLTNAMVAKATIGKLIELFEIISINVEDCRHALSLPVDDFEDALVMICAAKESVDYIVTRDKTFLESNSPIEVVLPNRLIEII